MTYEVKFTNEAQADLRSIFEYIAFQLQEPENAKRQFLRIEEMILSLDNMPERIGFTKENRGKAVGFAYCQ